MNAEMEISKDQWRSTAGEAAESQNVWDMSHFLNSRAFYRFFFCFLFVLEIVF